jgi:hypothetical protein
MYLYPLGTGWPRYTPGHWFPFPTPLTTLKATVEVFYPPPPHGNVALYVSEEPRALVSDCTVP